MQGYQFQIDKAPLLSIPLIAPAERQQAKIAKLVSCILESKGRGESTDTTRTEAEIDQVVYDLYGLTQEEIVAVERSTALQRL
jgi:hypothetical protein